MSPRPAIMTGTARPTSPFSATSSTGPCGSALTVQMGGLSHLGSSTSPATYRSPAIMMDAAATRQRDLTPRRVIGLGLPGPRKPLLGIGDKRVTDPAARITTVTAKRTYVFTGTASGTR